MTDCGELPARACVGDFDEAAVLDALRLAFGPAAICIGSVLGIGDDCAALPACGAGTRLLATTDALVAGTHFDGRWAEPSSVGHKALAVNLSDIAAMGGQPRAVLLALTLPARLPWSWLLRMAGAFGQAASAAGVSIVGGNLARGPAFSATVTVLGEVLHKAMRTRAGARPGERLVVTGALGGARTGLRVLNSAFAGGEPSADIEDAPARWETVCALSTRDPAVHALLRPSARVAWGASLAAYASAMIDVSDGLAKDAAHMAEASGVAMSISLGRLPRVVGASAQDALIGGEDYELLATVPLARMDALMAEAARAGLVVRDIGEVGAGEGVQVDDGVTVAPLHERGFEHWSAASK